MAKTTPQKKWQDFPLELYQQEAAKLVHFSGKTINSNVPACGVRLARDSALDLPLVGVRTLLADGVMVPLDYTQNAGKDRYCRQANAFGGKRPSAGHRSR
jgi:hypothetical protein